MTRRSRSESNCEGAPEVARSACVVRNFSDLHTRFLTEGRVELWVTLWVSFGVCIPHV